MNRLRAYVRMKLGWIPRPVRRVIVSVLGGTLLLLALIGFVLPIIPGFIFVPFGLAILAVEFAWAARWLKKIKRGAKNMRTRMRDGRSVAATPCGPALSATMPSASDNATPPRHNAAA